MFAFGYELTSEQNKNNKNIINLIKKEELQKEFDFELKFHNSQNREVSLYSTTDLYSANKPKLWQLYVKDIARFEVNSETNKVFYEQLTDCTEDHLKYWILHTFMPIYLTLKSNYVLHSAGLCLDNKAYLFLGQSFSGKSTFTHHAIQAGAKFLSDDKLLLQKDDQNFTVQSSYPYCRPSREVETLGYEVKAFEKESLEIGHIYTFKKVDPHEKISFKKIHGIDKFKILKACSDMELGLDQQKRFEFISEFANQIQLFELSIPWGIERINEVYDKVIEHIKEHS